MGTLSGIHFDEFPESNSLRFSPDGIVGKRVFLVAWTDRIEFAEIMLGFTNAVGHVPIRREAQTFPGYDRLYCQDLEIVRGIGVPSEVLEEASFPLARITAEYRPLRYGTTNTETDEFDEELEEAQAHFEQGLEFSAEMLSVAGSQFKYSEGPAVGTAVDTPMGIVVGTTDITMTSDAEPEVRWTAIRICLGKVNDAAFFGAPATYTLFLGASARRTLTSEGIGAWEVSYRFRERDVSWNKVLRGSVWTEIQDAATGAPPYTSVSFPLLWGI